MNIIMVWTAASMVILFCYELWDPRLWWHWALFAPIVAGWILWAIDITVSLRR